MTQLLCPSFILAVTPKSLDTIFFPLSAFHPGWFANTNKAGLESGGI